MFIYQASVPVSFLSLRESTRRKRKLTEERGSFQLPVPGSRPSLWGYQGRNFQQLLPAYLEPSVGRNECMQAGSLCLSVLDCSRAPAWEWGQPRWGGASRNNSLDQYNPGQRSRHYNTMKTISHWDFLPRWLIVGWVELTAGANCQSGRAAIFKKGWINCTEGHARLCQFL